MVPSRAPTISPFLKWGSQMHLQGPTLRLVLPPGEDGRRYRSTMWLFAVPDVIMVRAMSPFAKFYDEPSL